MSARELGRRRTRGAVVATVLLVASLGAPGCYTAQMTLLKSGLDSLRTQAETIAVRDSVTARMLEDTRRELGEQRELLHATRASTSSTGRETEETLGAAGGGGAW